MIESLELELDAALLARRREMCSREPASLFRLININEVGLSGRLRRLAARVYIENEAERAAVFVGVR